MAFPKDKYSIIYADPPWKYPARRNSGTRFGLGSGGHYEMMSTADICELPVQSISREEAFLLLWTTGPRLPDAMRVIEAWGFKFSTVIFVWIKIGKDGNPRFGPGYYTGSNAEFVLLGRTRRIYKCNSLSAPQVILAPRGKHSEKPQETRERIVKVFGDQPRIELFARERIPGWDAWGDEID